MAGARYPIGSMLFFRFLLPGDPEEVRCQGVVCNEDDERGMGVEFLGIGPQDRERITTFVAQHTTEA